jgi:hypothetical protein
MLHFLHTGCWCWDIACYKYQLLVTFKARLKANSATRQPLPRMLWDIVCPMVAQIITGYPSSASNQELQTELNTFNKDLEAYFRCISASSDQGDSLGLVQPTTTSLIQYLKQFFTQDAGVQYRIESECPEFWGGLEALKDAARLPTSLFNSSRYSNLSRAQTLVEPIVLGSGTNPVLYPE